ncbi:MAG: hypothetical protein LBC20_04845 [Planctomycetaceae bacterium]|jgi:hypothetical protein|nr:hypothetical protein [Planctomycetaceae bacterium]
MAYYFLAKVLLIDIMKLFSQTFYYFIFIIFSISLYSFGQDTDVYVSFTNIAKKNSADREKLVDGNEFCAIYLCRSIEPSKASKEKLESVERLLKEHNRKLDDQLENLKKRRNEMGYPLDMEEYKREREKSNAIVRASLTATENVTLESFFYKNGRIRKEILMIKDSRTLETILAEIKKNSESIRGMLSYYIYDNDYGSLSANGGDNPYTPDARNSVSASTLLDKNVSLSLRKKAITGIVRISSKKSEYIREFGHGFISQDVIDHFAKKNILSMKENKGHAEKEIICIIGKQDRDVNGHGETYSEYKLLPDKGYAISSFRAFLNGAIQSKMTYDNYVEIQDKIWFPQHILIETRVKPGEGADAFNQAEYLFVQPPSLKVDLEDAFFTINLTAQEKESIDKNESIQIIRRAIDVPEELR